MVIGIEQSGIEGLDCLKERVGRNAGSYTTPGKSQGKENHEEQYWRKKHFFDFFKSSPRRVFACLLKLIRLRGWDCSSASDG